MKRKIFISINLPDSAKKRLIKAIEGWRDLPVKWIKEPNLHLTLSFLGFMLDDSVKEICEKVQKAAEKFSIFDLMLEKIEIGPTQEKQNLIWLTGEASEDLRLLQESIEKELGIFVTSKKSFRPHITLGRIRQHKWQVLGDRPKIGKKFPLVVTVESVDVMASEFEDDGMEYTIIQSCPLK